MTETRVGTRGPPEKPDDPAVVLIAGKDNSDSVARSILRAQSRGHGVLVTHRNEGDIEAIEFAERLGSTVVHPRSSDPSRDELLDELAATARALDYPGIVVHEDPNWRVDFDRTLESFESDTYAVDAVYESDPIQGAETMIGLPAYNEAETIADVVADAREYANTVLVIDDGSEDETVDEARAAGATVISHDRNRGYGAALKTAFDEAARRDVDHLVILDADGQHDPSDVKKLVSRQKETDAEIVIGSRFVSDGITDAPLYRRVGLSIINTLTNLSMGAIRSSARIRDTQSGFRAYDEEAIESLVESDEIGARMDASTDILFHAHRNDFRVEEVGTEVTYEVDNASNHNPLFHGMNLVGNILRTIEKDRPITILGTPGLLSTIVGLGFGYWTFANYINTGTFPMGLALTSAIFGLTGTFACFTAIILHSLNQHLDS